MRVTGRCKRGYIRMHPPPRSLYTQLYGHKRKQLEGYAGLTVDNMVDFFKELPGR